MSLAFRPDLRRYVEAFLGRFGNDQRIIAWDLYNEPRARDTSVAQLHDVFAWARRVAPSQPLTACWSGALSRTSRPSTSMFRRPATRTEPDA